MLDDPALAEIAARLRQVLGPGRPALAHPARAHRLPEVGHARADQENFELFDFELERGDVQAIDALDRGEAGRDGPNPDTFAYIPSLSAAEK